MKEYTNTIDNILNFLLSDVYYGRITQNDIVWVLDRVKSMLRVVNDFEDYPSIVLEHAFNKELNELKKFFKLD